MPAIKITRRPVPGLLSPGERALLLAAAKAEGYGPWTLDDLCGPGPYVAQRNWRPSVCLQSLVDYGLVDQPRLGWSSGRRLYRLTEAGRRAAEHERQRGAYPMYLTTVRCVGSWYLDEPLPSRIRLNFAGLGDSDVAFTLSFPNNDSVPFVVGQTYAFTLGDPPAASAPEVAASQETVEHLLSIMESAAMVLRDRNHYERQRSHYALLADRLRMLSVGMRSVAVDEALASLKPGKTTRETVD